ncbi:MAG TPA: DUF2490 domain-containing protein [Bacteroidia bacterium]|nr:DUF2490 domain-containing protein [Bacteroidia bacterium]
MELNKKMMELHLRLKFWPELLFFLISISSFKSHAQLNKKEPIIGNWSMFTSQVRMKEKFGIHLEAQFRDYKLLNQPEQVILRTGIIYYINTSSNLTLGYASIHNFTFDDAIFEKPQVNENRMWEQLLLKQNIGKFYFEHRYRVEQRWIQTKTDKFYRDRLRYLLRLNIPLNKNTMESGTLFLSFYDELFVNITANPFDRNRLYGGFGYQFSKRLNAQIGYLAQTVGVITKSYFQMGVNCNFDLYAPKE